MHFPNVAVVNVDNPVGIIGSFKPVQRSNLRLDRDPFVDRGHAFGLALEMLIKLVSLDIFFRLTEPQPHSGTQPDILNPGFGEDHVPDNTEKLCVGFSSQ